MFTHTYTYTHINTDCFRDSSISYILRGEWWEEVTRVKATEEKYELCHYALLRFNTFFFLIYRIIHVQ